MRIIGLMPVRNEAWVLPHSLAALTGFCDVVIVSDQNSTDDSVKVAREFAKVNVIENSESRVCEAARWQLLDAARDFEGANLLWWIDADELISPLVASASLRSVIDEMRPGTVVETTFYQLIGAPTRYRTESIYKPSAMPLAIVDDRTYNYDRSEALPLHRMRVPLNSSTHVVRPQPLPVLHLQFLYESRNQVRQAWYRCREYLHGQKTAAEINRYYSIALPPKQTATAELPAEWIAGLTFPSPAADLERTWHEREVVEWFDRHGIERFEPLEIWHVDRLCAEFVSRTGRKPRPDRSYRQSAADSLTQRAKRFLTGVGGSWRQRA